jgi:choice-of-anchor B domain-containing protein
MKHASRFAWALAALILAAGAAPLGAQSYGSAVAATADQLLVAEPTTETRPGTIYVFERAGDGSWSVVQELRASDAAPGDYFGRSVAVDGDVLLAGATVKDSSRGAAYVFHRGDDGEWSQAQRIQPDDIATEDSFGRVVAVRGGVAAIATWGHDDGAGAVYLYERDPASGSWSRSDKLSVEGLSGAYFGSSIALDGDRILVGAFRKNQGAGAAYLFQRGDGTGWEQVASLEPRGLGQNSLFGASALLDGDEAVVAAPGVDGFTGAAWVYRYDAEEEAWSSTGRLLPFDGPQQAQFGASLARVGGEVWVGAPNAGGSEGRVYRFVRGDGGWTSADKLAVGDLEEGAGFGGSSAVSGDVALIGLPGDDFGAGTAMILERDGTDGWTLASRVFSELDNYAAVTGGRADCSGGQAATFGCEEIHVLSFLPVGEIGGSRGVEVNDVWGWTDPETDREYALVGRVDGTSFVDVTDPENPVYLGSLPKTEGSRANTWRDVKVYDDHAFIVADGAGDHGVQVFDLTRLRDVEDAPVTFEATAHYDGVASVHNIVINTETGFAYAVGSNGGGETCGGGLHMIDVRQPANPTFAGCFAEEGTGRQGTGYTHDAQCTIYRGPDEDYQGQELCFNANETAFNIADVTDKENPVSVATAEYPNVGYAHQGWLSQDHRYFFLDDELDELQGKVDSTRLMIWDVTDLDQPVLAKEWFAPSRVSDHNLYVVGDRLYWSTYVGGFRVLDVGDPENPEQLGYLDTVPHGEDEPSFGGSWSNYPFFESGNILVTSGSEGLFVLRPAPRLLSQGYHRP